MDTAILQTYVHIVDEGSFAAAARRMGISKSMCSKYISDLETSLGARLLTRSTRSVKPTTLGMEYYGKVKEILDRLQQANETVRSTSSHASGHLKVGAPISYTLRVLQPYLMRFTEDYPDVLLETVLDDSCTDLIGDGFDAAIRIGELDDSSLYVRRLHGSRVYVIASPGYVRDHGVPQKPSDLSNHRCLYYTNMRGSGTWPFQHGNEIVYQKIHPVFSANNGDLIRAAALAGKGIALMPEFMIEEDLRSGALVPLLSDYSLPEIPISLVYPTRKNMTAALRAFLDFTAGLELRTHG
ncbi:DNA-binding transcriptional regulator, LysR family [Gemmobacter aquatilis]|uniref:DNA-binding transcriptional regulator, LysR family n=1 Tax=Gemmobacter aquatilis TaxID=933059 RepID=A0A1H7ZHJ6_9RHOB|nr:LysR family transcriptional regulator [Gemmobacter aquatilis]SEM57880.1 DNA-binding transcriptional regulator, LysR family [Gemmobacter aquatilis]